VRAIAFAVSSVILTATVASGEGLDWEVHEREDAPAPILVARNLRDGALGLADVYFDANTALFGCVALAASQLFMITSDGVGLIDDNPVTQHVTKGVFSKSLAKIAYLWHLAGAESLLGSHGLEAERWATRGVATLNPLLADEDVEALEGPLPREPLAFVADSLFHGEVYQPAAPLVDLGATMVVDGALRPVASLLRFAQAKDAADAVDARASAWFLRAVEWGW
jgi:hypothetical protein